MRKFAKILGIVICGVMVLGGLAVGFLYLRKPAMRPPADIRIQVTPQRLERGKYIYTLADCDGCHSPRDFSRFDGPAIASRRGSGNVFPAAMGLPGTIAPPNITPDAETGIGSWTDGEKIRAIREGVDRDGRTLFPMMPYENFRHMSDEDVYSLVAYLNSLPAVRNVIPKSKVNFPVSLLVKSAPQPVTTAVPQPDRQNKVKYGEYLVTVAGCMECHTPTLGGGEKLAVAPGVMVVSANISPDPYTGTGRWTENDFVDRFYQYREYAEKGSPEVGPESFTLMPWLNLCQLPEEDLKAIYSFIRTRQPIYKAVDTHPAWRLEGQTASESASAKATRRATP